VQLTLDKPKRRFHAVFNKLMRGKATVKATKNQRLSEACADEGKIFDFFFEHLDKRIFVNK
jgi:hypothetical protein